MLYLLDILLTFIHLSIVLFNLLGWIPKASRKAHLVSIVLTAASWFLLGIWFGMGYCPFTDWQWSVKQKLGEENLPNNFIEYFAEKFSGFDFTPEFITTVTGTGFAISAFLSVYVNFLVPVIKKQSKK